jgi:hypothetical protein
MQEMCAQSWLIVEGLRNESGRGSESEKQATASNPHRQRHTKHVLVPPQIAGERHTLETYGKGFEPISCQQPEKILKIRRNSGAFYIQGKSACDFSRMRLKVI